VIRIDPFLSEKGKYKQRITEHGGKETGNTTRMTKT
jgi:hypothetical protein